MKLITSGKITGASTAVTATGPIVVSVTGLVYGSVRITANIGGGEADAYVHTPGDPTSLARLELPVGAIFKAYLEGGSTENNVNVDYVYV